MSGSQAYTQAEVDVILGIFGRKILELRDALEEADRLARAGEQVGFESAYRTLRRAVTQVVLEEPDVT